MNPTNQKYFKLLGIEPTTDINAIKKAYRKKALQFHPDRNTSANAKEKFIAITEAYEYLINPNKAATEKINVNNTEEAKAQKIRKAKERYKEMQRSEKKKDEQYYQHITTGIRWKVFKALAIYSMCFAILLSADFYLNRTSKTTTIIDPFPQLSDAIKIDNEIFITDYSLFFNSEFPAIKKNYSLFFNDLKSIEIINQPLFLATKSPPSNRNKQFDLFNRYPSNSFYAYSSVYFTFPYFHFFLLIPIFLVWFKKPNFTFSLLRLVCIWVIFPITIFLSLYNGRIFNLFIW